ncbi:MAG TPA: low molecular weight protein-tyrosine-phosphatase [Gammaproteobacteria bacterium]|nr:low molecular weight protein-tyrosine-phosphatase [Gammaproteobacteria bacterium]
MKSVLAKVRQAAARVIGRAEPKPLAARRVLFVCMGNICRSPTAEGVFRKLLEERAPGLDVLVDSAGTHAYHVGDPPDPRAQRAALRRGVDLSTQRARRVTEQDFTHFELVLAMDEQNREALLEICPVEHRGRVRLLLEFAPHVGHREVPDPYYGGSNGFEQVLDLVEEGAIGVLEHLRRTGPPAPPPTPGPDA